jgi:hypothetical protein
MGLNSGFKGLILFQFLVGIFFFRKTSIKFLWPTKYVWGPDRGSESARMVNLTPHSVKACTGENVTFLKAFSYVVLSREIVGIILQ